MTVSLPIQKHPFDQTGKVFVNKEWYLALLSIVNQGNSSGGQGSVDDVTLLEAIDAANASDGNAQKSISDAVSLLQLLLPQDETERLISLLRQIEIQIAMLPDYQDPVIKLVDEVGSGGTPGFAAGTDFVAGTTSTLTLSRNYKTASALWVAFDAAMQGADQFSLSGKVLSFTSPIPLGTTKVFVKGFITA